MSTDFRSRAAGPLTPDEWGAVDAAAQGCARPQLIGRRFLSLYGPLGAGVEYVAAERFAGPAAAQVSLPGAVVEIAAVADLRHQLPGAGRRAALPLPVIHRDLVLGWRDLARARQLGAGLDLSAVAVAAAEVALAEDALILRGEPRLGIEGLLSAAGIHAQPLSHWTAPGDAFAQVVQATKILLSAGHPGPYTLVLAPSLFALLERVSDLTGTLEISAVERLVRGAVLPSAAVTGAVLVDASPANMDLVVGVDLTVAYAGSEQIDHRLRVLETVVPRIKRPTAIVSFQEA